MKRAPIVEMKSKPNCEKLPEILKKLHIPEEKHQEIKHELKNNARKYEIIDILEELSDMMGKRCTHENTYKLYCINRDLKQLRAPIYQENMLSSSEVEYMPHEFIAMTVKEIVHEYEELNYRTRFLPMPVPRNPTKEHVMYLLDELLKYDVIFSYVRKKSFIEMPLDRAMPDDHEICVLRIL